MIPAHLADLPARSESDQAAFFAEVQDLTARSAERSRIREHVIDVAGLRVCLRFHGDALERLLLPALSHRVRDASAASAGATIDIWDRAGSGVPVPPRPVEKHCLSERGDIWTFTSQRFRSAFHYSDFSLNLMDMETGRGVFWVDDAAALPLSTLAAPFRTLFHWWGAHHGMQLVHAAALAQDGQAVLITGQGGTGKSSTALACLRSGMGYVGDDYVLLSRQPELRVHSLYRTAKLFVKDLPGAGSLANGAVVRDGEPKAVVYPGLSLASDVAVVLVLTPRFGDAAETGAEPVDHAYLTGAACYTTIAQLPHAGPATSAFIEAAFQSIPSRRLVLGTDRGRVAEAVRALAQSPPAMEPAARPVASQLVSVIIPLFNGTRFLPEAIASITAQDHPAIEIILVDDGSTEDVVAAADALPVQVRLVHQHNMGPAAARNLGIRAASGEILAFLDVDDLWPAGKLSTCLAWLAAHPDTDLVIGRAQVFQHGPEGTRLPVGNPAEAFPDYIGAAVYRRRAFERTGLFDPMLRFGEDIDWFSRAQHKGTVVDRIDLVTLEVRRHEQNMTKDRDVKDLRPLRLLKNAIDQRRAMDPSRTPPVR